MLTGRPVIAISVSRSGIKSGAMSGSSSDSGRLCTPGTKKPVTVNKPITRVADERQIEVARARAVGIESRAIAPSLAGHGAATKDCAGPGRNLLTDESDELFESFLTAAKRQVE